MAYEKRPKKYSEEFINVMVFLLELKKMKVTIYSRAGGKIYVVLGKEHKNYNKIMEKFLNENTLSSLFKNIYYDFTKDYSKPVIKEEDLLNLTREEALAVALNDFKKFDENGIKKINQKINGCEVILVDAKYTLTKINKTITLVIYNEFLEKVLDDIDFFFEE